MMAFVDAIAGIIFFTTPPVSCHVTPCKQQVPSSAAWIGSSVCITWNRDTQQSASPVQIQTLEMRIMYSQRLLCSEASEQVR